MQNRERREEIAVDHALDRSAGMSDWRGWIGRFPILFPIAWFAFYAPRIWRFGFYFGDWSDLMVINPWDATWWLFNSRPVALLESYVLPRWLGDNAPVWQLLLCLSMLISSFLFYSILIQVGALLERSPGSTASHRLTGDAVVACWLLFPWTLGWTAWPTLLMGLLSLVFFLLSIRLLLTAESVVDFIGAGCAYALCCLAYEPFWLAFFPFLLVLLLAGERRRLLRGSAVFLTVQALAVVYNRAMPHIMGDGGAAKIINYSALLDMPQALSNIPGQLLIVAPQTWELIENTAIAMAVATTASLLMLAGKGHVRIAGRYIALAIAAYLAIAFSVLQFRLASYGLIGTGEMSRTTIAISLWLAIFIFIFLRTAWFWMPGLIKPAPALVIAVLMYGLAVPLYRQNEVWAAAWRETLRVVANAPAAAIASLPPEAVIVYVGPTDVESVYYINRLQMWVALPTFHPETALSANEPSAVPQGRFPLDLSKRYPPLIVHLARAPEPAVAIRPIVVKADYHTLSWDGHVLTLALPKYWTEKFGADLVYEWDAYRGTIRQMKPFEPFGSPPSS
jgi:hypothetical protein